MPSPACTPFLALLLEVKAVVVGHLPLRSLLACAWTTPQLWCLAPATCTCWLSTQHALADVQTPAVQRLGSIISLGASVFACLDTALNAASVRQEPHCKSTTRAAVHASPFAVPGGVTFVCLPKGGELACFYDDSVLVSELLSESRERCHAELQPLEPALARLPASRIPGGLVAQAALGHVEAWHRGSQTRVCQVG